MAIRQAASTDVLIVGGGLTGLTLALVLSRAGLDVTVLDAADPASQRGAAFDGRVTSLAYGSCSMLRQLGVWSGIEAQAEAILDIRVSDSGMPFYLHFDHSDVGDRPFGYMVENRFLRTALHESAATATIDWMAPARADTIERHASHVTARLAGGGEIRATLAVGAEGRMSPLRREAGIRCLSWQYPQSAIVTTVAHELPHRGVAKEHFLPAGPFALLPMKGHRSSLVWTERQELAAEMLSLGQDEFDAEIQWRAGDHWGRMSADGPRWSYQLGLHNAERYIDRRLALVGDAAHAMHPIAGQGLNLGLRDVAALGEVVVEAARLGLDVGSETVLNRYQEWRRFDALTMLLMTDGLNRLFSNPSGLLRLLRGLGLGMVNSLPQAKRFFERRAAAMSGDLPRLVRGEAL